MIKKWRHCHGIDWTFSHVSLDKSQSSDVPQLKYLQENQNNQVKKTISYKENLKNKKK